MQTFLPYPDFEASMKILDMRRLGKQRVEAQQILNTLSGLSSGWKNHPATKMWEGYEEALKLYINAAITEWKFRGYKNTMQLHRIEKYIIPVWMGNRIFHLSHQSNLIRKLPEHYRKFFPHIDANIPYYWPVR